MAEGSGRTGGDGGEPALQGPCLEDLAVVRPWVRAERRQPQHAQRRPLASAGSLLLSRLRIVVFPGLVLLLLLLVACGLASGVGGRRVWCRRGDGRARKREARQHDVPRREAPQRRPRVQAQRLQLLRRAAHALRATDEEAIKM